MRLGIAIEFLWILLLFFVISMDVEAGKRKHHEAWYVEKFCSGTVEFKNTDGTRTDCKVDNYSVEFDFANKWYECLTQAGHYSILNDNEAICFLISEDPTKDNKYVERANRLISEWSLPVTIVNIDEDGTL